MIIYGFAKTQQYAMIWQLFFRPIYNLETLLIFVTCSHVVRFEQSAIHEQQCVDLHINTVRKIRSKLQVRYYVKVFMKGQLRFTL